MYFGFRYLTLRFDDFHSTLHVKMSDWGTIGIGGFTPTRHDKPYPAIDPDNGHLSSPSVVCMLGASRGIRAGVAQAYAYEGVRTLILSSRSSFAPRDLAQHSRELSPLGSADFKGL